MAIKKARSEPAGRRPAARLKASMKNAISKQEPERWEFSLYVTDQTPRSTTAFSNLKRICEEHLDGRTYRIEVIDLLEKPNLASGDQILAVPTTVRKHPLPAMRAIGDLSREESVLKNLGFPRRLTRS